MSDKQLVALVEAPESPPPTSDNVQEQSPSQSASQAPNEARSEPPKKRLTGYLVKQATKGPLKLWHTRWFIFDDRRCMLFYYRSPQDFVPLGSIDIAKASLSFDVENADKGQFSISVDSRQYLLQAQSKKAMMFWLSELQNRRRSFSQRRLKMPRKGVSVSPKQLEPRGGLTGSSAEPESPLSLMSSSGSTSSGFFEFSLSSLRNKPFLHRSTSSTAGQKASQAAASARANMAQIKAKEQKQSSTNPAVLVELCETDAVERQPNGGDGVGGKGELTPKQRRKLGWSISLESVKKKISLKRFTSGGSIESDPPAQDTQQPVAGEVSVSRKSSEDEMHKIVTLRDDLEAAEFELSAKTQVIQKLHRDLRELQLEKSATEQFVASQDKDRLQLLVKRDQKIILLEEAKLAAEEDKLDTEQQMRECEHKLSDAEEQLSMFREMLQAKDQVVMNLTNQLFELENKPQNKNTNQPAVETGYGIVTESGRIPFTPDTIQQLQRYKDACEGYKMQNSFLNSEVLELNRLRVDDAERMGELSERLTTVEAELCKVQSNHLLLIEEVNKPRRGGESGPSQDVISWLLEDAMSSDVEVGGAQEKQREDTDQYGFKHSMCKDETMVETMVNRLLQQSKQLEDTDAAHLVRWENYLLQRGKRDLEYSADLKNLIRGGIPHEHRSEIWTPCVHSLIQDVKAEKGSGYYQRLVKSQSQSHSSSVFFRQIELDLLRTMPNNKFYDRPDADGVIKLRNVLQAYALHNPTVGYCQGINRLVAIALLYMDEENAFWCLLAIVEVLMPPEYYSNTLLASQVDQRVLKDILAEKMPRLHAHFEHHHIDLSLITFNWFLTVFVDNTPVELSLRVWDSFLYEGSKVLFRFALAIFKWSEEDLLKLNTTMTLFNYARVMAHKCHDLKRLSHIAFYDMNPFPMKNITAKRTLHSATVQAQLQELENIRAACQRSYSFQDSQVCERGTASDDEI